MKKLLLFTTLFGLLFLLSCGKNDPITPQIKTYSVYYRVTGTAKTVNVTMSGQGESTIQYSNLSLPYQYDVGTVNEGAFLYISAQNEGSIGSITVKIYVDNNVYKSASSSGAYVLATASGSAGG